MFRNKRSLLTGACIFLIFLTGLSQTPVVRSVLPEAFRPANQYQISWQRLLLQLSSTFYTVVNEGQIDLDSSLLIAGKYLGLSRIPLIAEGILDSGQISKHLWIDQRKPGKGVSLLNVAKGKEHLELLVLLGAYYAFQPGGYHIYRDSIEFYLQNAIGESKKQAEKKLGLQALCLLGKIYVQGANPDYGDTVFNRLIQSCQAQGDRETEAKAYAYRGLYMAFSPNSTEKRISYLQKAAGIFHGLKNREEEANCLTNIGYLFVVSFQLPAAQDQLLKALDLEKSMGFPYTHYNTDAVAMVTGFQGGFGEPLKFSIETVQTAEATRDSLGLAYFYSRIASVYTFGGSNEPQMGYWARKAQDRFIIMRDGNLYTNLYNLISWMCNHENFQKALDLALNTYKDVPPKNIRDKLGFHIAIANCYIGLKQYDLAEINLLQADQYQKQAEAYIGPFRRALISAFLGFVYFHKGQFEKAKKYFDFYLSDHARSLGTLGTDLPVYNDLIYIDSINRDDASALRHYRVFVKLLDSNFHVTKTNQAEEFQIQYLTREKESQIVYLNESAKLQQVNLKEEKRVKNLTIVGILALLVIAGLLYRQNLQRKKNNQTISDKNGQLEHLVTEKEWLLKEIHHRVKNNFQTVMGLLGTQSGYLKHEVAIDAITNSRHRIHAMSLIHQKLYQTVNLSEINMSDYIHDLVDYLRDSFESNKKFRFILRIEPLALELTHCIPLGLIINEAITNSYKYAFPNGVEGTITINLISISKNEIYLTISDNGQGLPADFNPGKMNSMGMNLMQGLSREMDAHFRIFSQNGTHIEIRFTLDPDILARIDRSIPETTLV